jgi:hypothetical protein
VRYHAAVRVFVVTALLLIATVRGAAAAEIGQIAVSPAMPQPGATIVITFELRNSDRRPLLAGVVEVLAGGKRIGHIATPPLPAGGTTRVSQGVTLPNVFVERLRIDLLPLSGQAPASVVISMSRREPGAASTPAGAPLLRSRELAAPNFIGTQPVRSRELAAPNFIGTQPVRTREVAAPNFIGTQPVRTREVPAPNFIGTRPQ